MTPLDAYLRRSKAARAVLGIYRSVRNSRCGGLTASGMAGCVAKRFGDSTVRQAIANLMRIPNGNGLPPLVATGKWRRRSRVLRAR